MKAAILFACTVLLAVFASCKKDNVDATVTTVSDQYKVSTLAGNGSEG